MIRLLSCSEEDTVMVGKYIGEAAQQGDIILLMGDLGSGKTAISKGIAAGAQVNSIVTSPTYALMNLYQGRLPVYHFDIYRLQTPEELYDLDYEEYFYGDGLTIVEWPERMDYLIPDQYLMIRIEKCSNMKHREIVVVSVGNCYERYERVLKQYEGPRY